MQNHQINRSDHFNLIYIMGDGRSGSTILAILLGNHPRIESVGELYRWVEFNGYAKPGDNKSEDEQFWKSVRKEYVNHGYCIDFSELIKAQKEIEDYGNFFNVLFGKVDSHLRQVYLDHHDRLLNSISKVSGKLIIVDSSRNMGRAYMLLRHYSGSVRVIHLVRDPRGVFYSQIKSAIEQDYKPPIIAGIDYLLKNLLSTIVVYRASKGSIIRIRYEDLILNPSKALFQIENHIGISMKPVIRIIESKKPLFINHILDGNRLRKNTTTNLILDNEWEEKLKPLYRILAVFLSFPFFIRYGYFRSRIKNHLEHSERSRESI